MQGDAQVVEVLNEVLTAELTAQNHLSQQIEE